MIGLRLSQSQSHHETEPGVAVGVGVRLRGILDIRAVVERVENTVSVVVFGLAAVGMRVAAGVIGDVDHPVAVVVDSIVADEQLGELRVE